MPLMVEMPDALLRLMPALARAARRMAQSPEQARDLRQDVLLKLWARTRRDPPIDDLRAYAMTALRNEFRQTLRREWPVEHLEDEDRPVPTGVFAAMALHKLDEAITTLPAPQQRLMRLVAQGETSPRVLSQITGWPLGTVMSRLARARMRLRAELGLAARAPVAELL